MLRLASLLWRLRRATTIETALFEIQADHLNGFRQARQVHLPPREVVYALFGRAELASFDRDPAPANLTMEQNFSLAPSRNRLNLLPVPPLSSRVAFFASHQSAQLRPRRPQPI